MTGNLKLLINFVWKFMGTVRFRNDHVAAILGFGDLQWGNILITRVYFVKGSGHNLFSVGQFCDSDLEVAFRRNACFVRNLEGVDLLKGDRSTNLYTINLHEMASASPICLMARASSTKSSKVHIIRNIFVLHVSKKKAKKHLIHPNLFQIQGRGDCYCVFHSNRSIIHRRFNKTPYELINGKKLDISFLHVFGALCYPKNDREDIRKLGAKGDIGYFADSCAYRIYNRRTKKIIKTLNVSFDELSAMAFEQRSSKLRLQSMTFGQISLGLDLTYALSTITTQQPTEDTAPTPTNSSSHATNIPITSQDVDELNPNALFDGNTNQLGSDGDICMYALSVSTIEPKNVKEAMTDPEWIDSMQEDLLQFKRLDALYGLKQALRAWYDELSTFLLQNHFFKGTIDPALFIRRFLDDILVAKPTEKHLKEVKRIFCYLWGTVNTGLWYTNDSGFKLTGFSDADYAGCKDTFKNTFGGAQFLDEKLLTDYGFHFNKILIYYDSKLSIAISYNPVQHSRTKHIAVRYHFIKEHVEKGTIELYFVKTDYQLADLFTKSLSADCFNYLVRRLGMRSLSPQELDRLAKSRQSQRDLPRNTPLDRVEVLVMNGNPSRVIIKQLCGRIRRWRYNLIPAESKFKTPCSIIKDKYMMKAQVHVSKSSTISDVQALPQKKHYLQNVKVYVKGEIVSKLSRS
nr:copia protein [Tanacetum cinerariifolium]